MAIQIRPIEPKCTIILSKDEWFDLLIILTKSAEYAATDEIEKVLRDVMTASRSFIFRKGGSGPLCLELGKEEALNFALHLGDFFITGEDQLTSKVYDGIKSIQKSLKNYLLGESKNEHD